MRSQLNRLGVAARHESTQTCLHPHTYTHTHIHIKGSAAYNLAGPFLRGRLGYKSNLCLRPTICAWSITFEEGFGLWLGMSESGLHFARCHINECSWAPELFQDKNNYICMFCDFCLKYMGMQGLSYVQTHKSRRRWKSVIGSCPTNLQLRLTRADSCVKVVLVVAMRSLVCSTGAIVQFCNHLHFYTMKCSLKDCCCKSPLLGSWFSLIYT